MTDFKEVGKLEMTKELAINLTALLIVALLVFGSLFTFLYTLFTGRNELGGTISIKGGITIAFLFFSTLIFHELIHGAFISKYGGTPRYGMGITYILPYFYATTDTRFPRNKFIVIALAPLAVISLVCLILMVAFPDLSHWMLIPLIINSSGAVGDLYMSFISLRFPDHVLVEDNITELTFYGRQSDHTLNISTESPVLNFLKGFTIAFTAMVILSLVFPVYMFFQTMELRVYVPFWDLLPVSGFAGLVYSIIKSASNKKNPGRLVGRCE